MCYTDTRSGIRSTPRRCPPLENGHREAHGLRPRQSHRYQRATHDPLRFSRVRRARGLRLPEILLRRRHVGARLRAIHHASGLSPLLLQEPPNNDEQGAPRPILVPGPAVEQRLRRSQGPDRQPFDRQPRRQVHHQGLPGSSVDQAGTRHRPGCASEWLDIYYYDTTTSSEIPPPAPSRLKDDQPRFHCRSRLGRAASGLGPELGRLLGNEMRAQYARFFTRGLLSPGMNRLPPPQTGEVPPPSTGSGSGLRHCLLR